MKRVLTHIIKFSSKVHACSKSVRVIKNSGPCNSMMDRLISEDIGVSLKMIQFET